MPTCATFIGKQDKDRGSCKPCWPVGCNGENPTLATTRCSGSTCQVVSSKKTYVREQESNVFPLLQQSWWLRVAWPNREKAGAQPGANRAAHPSLKRQTRSPWLIPMDATPWTSHSFRSPPAGWSKVSSEVWMQSHKQHHPHSLCSICSMCPLYSIPAHKVLGWGEDAAIWQLHKEHNCQLKFHLCFSPQ